MTLTTRGSLFWVHLQHIATQVLPEITHSVTTVHQLEPDALSHHFPLVASTRQTATTHFTTQPPLSHSRHTSLQPIKLSNGSMTQATTL